MVTVIVCEQCNHHNKITKERKQRRKPKTEQMLYEVMNNFFEQLQEPKNKYELGKALNTNYKYVEKFVNRHILTGNIQVLNYNPNKYMLSMQGRKVLYLVKELNKFVTTWQSDIVLPHDKIGIRFVPI
jgi:hypothetical protein